MIIFIFDYWKNPPEKISFRNSSGIESIFTPEDLKAFSVENIIYVSADTEIETSTKRAASLPEEPELMLKTDNVFLLMLVSGPESLYHYSKEMMNDNFYTKQDGEYKLLKYKKYQKQENGQTVTGENLTFIGQLHLYLNNCPDIQSILEDTRYTEKSLINVFKDYYNCVNTQALIYKKPRKSELEYGPVIGATVTSLSLNGNHPFLSKVDFADSKNIAAGAFLEVILNKNIRTWSVYNEMLYTAYNFNEHYNPYEDQTHYTNNEIIIKYQYLNLNSMLRYRLKIGETALFANTGLSLGFIWGKSNRRIARTYSSTLLERERIENAVAVTRRRDLSYIAGFGAEFKNVSLQFRYETGKGISKVANLNSPTSSLALLLTYSF